MRYIESCDNCGSKDWRVYGTAVTGDSVHYVQCRCDRCGLVFTNPRATESELKTFYAQYYSKVRPDRLGGDWERNGFDYFKKHIQEVAVHVKRGRLLEIGAGTGVFLKVAKDQGYEIHGVELSAEAVAYAKEKFGIDTLFCGMVEDAGLPSDSFNVIYAWHLIEHVPDLDRFVKELHRVLKPNGLLYLGTESYFHLSTIYARLACFKGGRVPDMVTSSQHTFVFHPASLRDCLSRRGFNVVDITGYDEVSIKQRIRAAYSPSWRRRMMMRTVVGLAPMVNRVLGTGPFLKAIAVKGA